jgi:hypothetical protein
VEGFQKEKSFLYSLPKIQGSLRPHHILNQLNYIQTQRNPLQTMMQKVSAQSLPAIARLKATSLFVLPSYLVSKEVYIVLLTDHLKT